VQQPGDSGDSGGSGDSGDLGDLGDSGDSGDSKWLGCESMSTACCAGFYRQSWRLEPISNEEFVYCIPLRRTGIIVTL
jgi:hypothetical protein